MFDYHEKIFFKQLILLKASDIPAFVSFHPFFEKLSIVERNIGLFDIVFRGGNIWRETWIEFRLLHTKPIVCSWNWIRKYESPSAYLTNDFSHSSRTCGFTYSFSVVKHLIADNFQQRQESFGYLILMGRKTLNEITYAMFWHMISRN